MIRGLDDDFMGAGALHGLKEEVSRSLPGPLASKSGEFVGNHAEGPAGTVGRRAVGTKGEEFRRCGVFVPGTEGTEAA